VSHAAFCFFLVFQSQVCHGGGFFGNSVSKSYIVLHNILRYAVYVWLGDKHTLNKQHDNIYIHFPFLEVGPF
jgi:hypothetical protein